MITLLHQKSKPKVISWTEEEKERMGAALREFGVNYEKITEMVGSTKTRE